MHLRYYRHISLEMASRFSRVIGIVLQKLGITHPHVMDEIEGHRTIRLGSHVEEAARNTAALLTKPSLGSGGSCTVQPESGCGALASMWLESPGARVPRTTSSPPREAAKGPVAVLPLPKRFRVLSPEEP